MSLFCLNEQKIFFKATVYIVITNLKTTYVSETRGQNSGVYLFRSGQVRVLNVHIQSKLL